MAAFGMDGDEFTFCIARVSLVSYLPEYRANEFLSITPALLQGTIFLLQQYYEEV
jgi:hypothetical protein